MIKHFDNFLNESKVGKTFKVSDIIESSDSKDEFDRKMRNLVSDCEIRVINPYNDKKEIIKNGEYVRLANGIMPFEELKQSAMMGYIKYNNGEKRTSHIFSSRDTITILSEPKRLFTPEDPYGEEMWEKRLNEAMLKKELLDTLKKARYIEVSPKQDGSWGVEYHLGGEQLIDGDFNTNAEVHEFLIDNDIDYGGRNGYEYMRKHRARMNRDIPYTKYQDELIKSGIDKELL